MEQRNITVNNQKYSVGVRDEADDSVLAEIFKLGEYRIAEDAIQNAEDAIIDVGAHAGYFSLYVRAFNQTVPIFALEPEPNNIRAFQENIKSNAVQNVSLIPGALASKTTIRDLLISTDSHNHALMSVGEKSNEKVSVQAHSLKDILKSYHIPAVDLIKFDIEGGEYEVFESLEAETFLKIKTIVLEYHNSKLKNATQIEKLLRENGFSVQKFPSKFDKTMGFLFANNKRFQK